MRKKAGIQLSEAGPGLPQLSGMRLDPRMRTKVHRGQKLLWPWASLLPRARVGPRTEDGSPPPARQWRWGERGWEGGAQRAQSRGEEDPLLSTERPGWTNPASVAQGTELPLMQGQWAEC